MRHSLPLSVGSDGYDQEQDYTLKSYLPANSLSSIYGPSGSYKSFLAVSWACHVAGDLNGLENLSHQCCDVRCWRRGSVFHAVLKHGRNCIM